MHFGRIKWVMWSVAMLALVTSGGCREETRHAGKALGVLSTCSSDCNGALEVSSCHELAPALYVAGTAYCDGTCTPRFDECERHEITDCDPMGDNPCGANRVCVQTGLDASVGQCVDDPGLRPSCSPEAVTRCTGSRLERCTDDGWVLYEDCAGSGGLCRAELLGEGYRCASPTAGCVPGTTRCDGSILQTCDGDGFSATDDCAEQDEVCASGSRGQFACVFPATGCDYSGIGQGTLNAMVFDADAAAYFKNGDSYLSMTAETSDARLSIEMFGDHGAPAAADDAPFSIALSGAESDYSTCRVCVVATRRDVDRVRTFMPIEGTLQLSALPERAGDEMSIRLFDVAMREVEIDPTWSVTREVSGGSSWCFASRSLSKIATGYGCDSEGSAACANGSERVVCSGGALERQQCDPGTVCRESARGAARCGPPLKASDCDISTHLPWWTEAYFDTDAWQYAAASSRGLGDDILFAENFPEVGGLIAPGTVSIFGDQSDRRTCSTCLWAVYGSMRFVARYGIIEVTDMPAQTGDAFSISARDVQLHQVDAGNFDVPGGLTWCLESVAYGGKTGRYPCFGAYYGNRTCAGDRLLECNLGNTWQLDSDCSASGLACVPTGSGVASCQ